uniref:Uncharacterized protein n=1 Tax=Seriola lalandi dorsalis TaxID=1841481 RepID=A0A3B4XH73_SERLL
LKTQSHGFQTNGLGVASDVNTQNKLNFGGKNKVAHQPFSLPSGAALPLFSISCLFAWLIFSLLLLCGFIVGFMLFDSTT